jgi:hypothetical protein
MYFKNIRKVFDGYRDVPVTNAGSGRQPVPTSGFLQYECEVDWRDVAEGIRLYSDPDAAFYFDAAFLGRREYPDELWGALLSRRIIFTPDVWEECQPWFNDPFAHKGFHAQVVEARITGSDRICWLDPMQWDEPIRASAGYYISLLGARKLVGDRLKENFVKIHGREPSSEELVALIQKHFGDRALTLALKGLEDIRRQKTTFFADEELIVLATIDAMLNGRETYIWTQDPDAIEQTYKFQCLLDTHYKSFYISKYYQDHRSTVTEQILPVSVGSRINEWFEPQDLISVFFHKDDLPNVVLPKERTPVSVYCQRFIDRQTGWKLQNMSFIADRGAKVVLDIKGKNSGLNTLDLDGCNLHIVCAPPFPDGMGGRVLIGKDRTTKFRGLTLACLDVHYAQVQCERFQRLRYSD